MRAGVFLKMPVKQGGKLVELTPSVVKQVEHFLESKRRPESDFTKLVNAILEDMFAKEYFLQYYLPKLNPIAAKDESIYIKDNDTRKIFEVSIRDNKVLCFEDNSDSCEHAKYAMAYSEFGKIVRHNLQKIMDVAGSKNQSSDKDSDSESTFLHSKKDLRNQEFPSFVPSLT